MMLWAEFHKWSAALCAWREARHEGRDGIRAVLHVIQNRARLWNKTWAEIVYQPMQFSSMTYPHDPQLAKIPTGVDPVFVDCYEIADSIFVGGDFDLTQGATHYFATSIPEPEWAKQMTFLVQIGSQKFYKEKQ